MKNKYIFNLKSDIGTDTPTQQTIPAESLDDAQRQLFDLGYDKDGVHYVLEGDDWKDSFKSGDLIHTIEPCDHDYPHDMIDAGGDAEDGPVTISRCTNCNKVITQYGM